MSNNNDLESLPRLVGESIERVSLTRDHNDQSIMIVEYPTDAENNRKIVYLGFNDLINITGQVVVKNDSVPDTNFYQDSDNNNLPVGTLCLFTANQDPNEYRIFTLSKYLTSSTVSWTEIPTRYRTFSNNQISKWHSRLVLMGAIEYTNGYLSVGNNSKIRIYTGTGNLTNEIQLPSTGYIDIELYSLAASLINSGGIPYLNDESNKITITYDSVSDKYRFDFSSSPNTILLYKLDNQGNKLYVVGSSDYSQQFSCDNDIILGCSLTGTPPYNFLIGNSDLVNYDIVKSDYTNDQNITISNCDNPDITKGSGATVTYSMTNVRTFKNNASNKLDEIIKLLTKNSHSHVVTKSLSHSSHASHSSHGSHGSHGSNWM